MAFILLSSSSSSPPLFCYQLARFYALLLPICSIKLFPLVLLFLSVLRSPPPTLAVELRQRERGELQIILHIFGEADGDELEMDDDEDDEMLYSKLFPFSLRILSSFSTIWPLPYLTRLMLIFTTSAVALSV
ncbi:PREDICTED: uncharacterized protein LOC105970636 [Erythranthe guttata]|uniref:uncharacterized protein LOC105957934 n=1 Tax=Erythranthe guttata TaxID=4155 RepID=UPI00064E02E0|nr:PREDICTED: uncharacterized protein LOC105957934 [Erythranthe guttata]XP_012850924.1 PREDICTED: uncharacterized protein LOC105970636 [Erythranthe guttata]|eukprot:XP_012837375.1 PREDICTED: uncharacterized protein LOC105957934 [Erythranthe guttata]